MNLYVGVENIFEKTRGPDGRFQDMNTHVYNDYKLSNGLQTRGKTQKVDL